ncbi:MAG: tRNA (5-methylaminomethyl-2-thiouridine)(34)-methyltransferase MnmD [Chitinophagaceae bacterium]
MQRNIIVTADGSHSVEIPSLQVTYHSVHGAIRESMHVFIEAGLHYWHTHAMQPECRILEMGFGTGLNALLTYSFAIATKQKIHYETIEAFPLSTTETAVLNYCEQLHQPNLQPVFEQLHSSNWHEAVSISEYLTLQKHQVTIEDFSTDQLYHIVFYDAFAPRAQPELWTEDVFRKLLNQLYPGGILVTYCSKGDVRRALMAAGFTVAKLTGPPGKREMLRAIKA